MSEAVVNTKTIITRSSSSIDIFSFYQKCTKYLDFFISDVRVKIQDVWFNQGELGYTVDQIEDTFYLNDRGELVVKANNTSQYNIDEDGNLTTNIDFCGNLITE